MTTFTHRKNGTILPEQPAEHSDFETEGDGETEEERMYDETLLYLMHGRCPEGASMQDKGSALSTTEPDEPPATMPPFCVLTILSHFKL